MILVFERSGNPIFSSSTREYYFFSLTPKTFHPLYKLLVTLSSKSWVMDAMGTDVGSEKTTYGKFQIAMCAYRYFAPAVIPFVYLLPAFKRAILCDSHASYEPAAPERAGAKPRIPYKNGEPPHIGGGSPLLLFRTTVPFRCSVSLFRFAFCPDSLWTALCPVHRATRCFRESLFTPL